MNIPSDIQYLIASYVVPPVYRLAKHLSNNINWDELCYNRHPGMIPLIDAYFERCLTIQSHLDYIMLERLSSNPTAAPLIEKYKYHFIQRKIPIDWKNLDNKNNKNIQSIYQNPDIFELDKVATKKAEQKFVIETFN